MATFLYYVVVTDLWTERPTVTSLFLEETCARQGREWKDDSGIERLSTGRITTCASFFFVSQMASRMRTAAVGRSGRLPVAETAVGASISADASAVGSGSGSDQLSPREFISRLVAEQGLPALLAIAGYQGEPLDGYTMVS